METMLGNICLGVVALVAVAGLAYIVGSILGSRAGYRDGYADGASDGMELGIRSGGGAVNRPGR